MRARGEEVSVDGVVAAVERQKPTRPGTAQPAPEADPPEERAALDRLIHAWMGRFTLGLSPASLAAANMDWLVHLAIAPGKQLELAHKVLRKSVKLAMHAAECAADPAHPPPPCCRVAASTSGLVATKLLGDTISSSWRAAKETTSS